VYSELPQDVGSLPKASAEYSLIPSSNPAAVSFVPTCWTKFPIWYTGFNNAVVFLGERATVRGERRLVCVVFTGWGGDHINRYANVFYTGTPSFDVISVNIGTLRSPPRPQVWSSGGVSYADHVPRSVRLRLFAGQPDPHNESRFTIPYELNGLRDVIEGRLGRGDNDIVLTPHGPLKELYNSP
jgi:hypothetical protein